MRTVDGQEGLTPTQCQMLAMEEKTAAFYLVEGSNALSSLQKATGFYPLAFGLLANGVERLLKLDLIAGALRTQGRPPARSEFRKLSHDLASLSKKVVHLPSQSAERGSSLLEEDEVLSSLLITLSEFARDGRYLYMDRVLDATSQAPDPMKSFRTVEEAIFRATSETGTPTDSWIFAYGLTGQWQTYVRRRNEFLIESLLRFVMVLTRMFVELVGISEAGYLRIFLGEKKFGRAPSRPEFRKIANSPDLDRWELDLEHHLVGSHPEAEHQPHPVATSRAGRMPSS